MRVMKLTSQCKYGCLESFGGLAIVLVGAALACGTTTS